MKRILAALAFAAVPALAIINGEIVDPKDYPHVVMIEVDGGARCSATLIGPRVLITVAHCAMTGSFVKFEVNGRAYTARATRSPHFPKEPHDLALALVKGEVEDAQPISVGAGPGNGTSVELAGFGCAVAGGGGPVESPPKLRAGSTLVTSISTLDFITKQEGGAVVCWGDSGGPVVDYGKDRGRLVGVTSRGDINTVSLSVRLDIPESRNFLTQFADEHQVEICGINADCR